MASLLGHLSFAGRMGKPPGGRNLHLAGLARGCGRRRGPWRPFLGEVRPTRNAYAFRSGGRPCPPRRASRPAAAIGDREIPGPAREQRPRRRVRHRHQRGPQRPERQSPPGRKDPRSARGLWLPLPGGNRSRLGLPQSLRCGRDSLHHQGRRGVPHARRRVRDLTTKARRRRSMAYKVTMIPGDGVGPELSEATMRVLDATGVGIEWEILQAGENVMEEFGTPLPEHVLESIRRNKVAIKGPITTPVGKGFRSVNVALRKELDLYALYRPCKSYAGVRSRYSNIDILMVRENTEDIYIGIEFQQGTEEAKKMIDAISEPSGKAIRPDSGLSIKPISIFGTRRVVRSAFEYARANGRKQITAVHKANIMKFTDGLFLRVAQEVARDYPDIEFQDRIVDNMCMQLVQVPEKYDMLVLPNLYGDIVSDLGAGLVGGLGLAPGANMGDEIAVFEATHGSAPKYAGLNKMNPMAMLLSGVMMLRHLKEPAAAERLEDSIASVIAEGKNVTYDMKPDRNDPTAVGTSQVADAVIEKLQAGVGA